MTSWTENLAQQVVKYSKPVFSTSFSIEDQIITDQIVRQNLPVDIFTLDTGRLPNETYKVWQKTLDKYQIRIQAFYPNEKKLEEFISHNGINAFYNSTDLRHKCCDIRKIQPLKRALESKTYNLWISGIRKEHSESRGEKPMIEQDNGFNIIKFYPVLELTQKEVMDFIKKYDIPYNGLYDKGYKSIGCTPCTRALREGEKNRDGRWWWENSSKECGLHMVNGKLVKKNFKDDNKKT
jgi:phosphoadenosine phosphosulfate reductase